MSEHGAWIVTAEEAALPDRGGLESIGGKGANLVRLAADPGAAAGPGAPELRVPPWYAVTTAAFLRALDRAGLLERIEDRLRGAAEAGDEALAAAGAEVRGWIEELPLDEELAAALAAAHVAVLPADPPVAVRSSASAEDAGEDSFAGLHDSFLFVRGQEAVAARVRNVWASAYNERALGYRQRRGLPLHPIPMAVVIQEMVNAEVSAVLFTADPTTGDVHTQVASALWGAGEGLVSAGLDADTYRIAKADLSIESEVAQKDERLVLDAERGGLRREPVPAALCRAPCLDGARVTELARLGLHLERRFGRPQDVEVSWDGQGRLWVLQTRPVTTVEEYGPAAGNPLVWDNSNIIESYSGVTSPMTFSFIRRAYAIVYHCFAEVMGIDAERIRAHRPVFENMLGLFRGQVYYNLGNWYRLVRLFPGYQWNRRFMESMMGVREPLLLEDDEPPAGFVRRWFRELPALLRLVARSVWRFLGIRRIVSRFEAHFEARYAEWSALDFDRMAPHELHALYRRMEDELLWEWKAPIVNDFFVMVFYGTLRALCARWCGDEAGSLQNDLLCGQGGIESTRPARELLALAGSARGAPELARVLEERSAAELALAFGSGGELRERFPTFAAAVDDHLERFGFRCMNELKLEEPSLAERPAFLYEVLRNYVAMPEEAFRSALGSEERERAVRDRAEERAFGALGRLSPRRPILRWILGNARLGVRNRENLRFARTKIYGLLREMLVALGGRLAREGILDDPRDVFHLALEEVWDYVRGAAVTTDLRGLADLRRREYAAFRSETERFPADRFVTYGLPYHRNLFRAPASATTTGAGPDEGDDGLLRGIGCCPGVVAGPVKVVRSPEDDVRLSGEILVAGRTDPGWVPLYPSASGLLIERGSILSHSAIVAREMGLPAIVGIPGLLARLATGMRVEMDGAAGTVRVVEGGAAADEGTGPSPPAEAG